jgi:hypothetical protein
MCKKKVCNEKIKFMKTIIHDIDKIRTFEVEFLHKSKRRWRVRE